MTRRVNASWTLTHPRKPFVVPATEDWDAEIAREERRQRQLQWQAPTPLEDWEAEIADGSRPPVPPFQHCHREHKAVPWFPSKEGKCQICKGWLPLEMQTAHGSHECYYCGAHLRKTYFGFLRHLDRCPRLPLRPQAFLAASCKCNQRF